MLKIKILHFFALAIVRIAYSNAGLRKKFQPRIVSGFLCDTTEAPYFVSIVTKADPKSLCGGTLLTYEWVLTAAHCILPKLLKDKTATIYSGFDMPSLQLRQVRNAKEFHIHPKFVEEDFLKAKDFRFDIGLILVDEPFRRTVATHVAILPAPGFAKQCKRATSPGLGETYNRELLFRKPAEKRPLKCVELDMVDTNSCKKVYEAGRGSILFDDTIMCTHEAMKGVCRGDSGGPVVCNNIVIGVVSYGPMDCEMTPAPNTFTMVEKHLDFIDNILKFTGIKRSP